MFGLGTWELLLILMVILIFFGVGKLPQVAKELGSGVRGFQKALKGEEEEEEETKQLDAEDAADVAESKSKSKAEA